jgi:hypothetical protein
MPPPLPAARTRANLGLDERGRAHPTNGAASSLRSAGAPRIRSRAATPAAECICGLPRRFRLASVSRSHRVVPDHRSKEAVGRPARMMKLQSSRGILVILPQGWGTRNQKAPGHLFQTWTRARRNRTYPRGTQAPVARAKAAQGHAQAATVDRADDLLQLRTDDRELLHRRAEQRVLQRDWSRGPSASTAAASTPASSDHAGQRQVRAGGSSSRSCWQVLMEQAHGRTPRSRARPR